MIAAETLAMLDPRPPLPDPSVTDDHGRPITRLRRDGPPEAGVWRCFVGAEFVGRITASTEAIWRCGLWPALGRDDLLAALARLGRAWGKQRTEAAIYATWSDEDLVAEIWRRLPPMSTGGVFNPAHQETPGVEGRLVPTTEPGADAEFVVEPVGALDPPRRMPGDPGFGNFLAIGRADGMTRHAGRPR